MNYKKRCADCANLIEKKGEWCCEECFGQFCKEIDDCPEGVTVEDVEEIEEKSKSIKVDTGAGKGKRKTPTKRERKENPLKKEIISALFTTLSENYSNVSIENDEKYINFVANGANFTINLVQHREKKTN